MQEFLTESVSTSAMEREPSVLFLCAGSGVGGMERVVRNLSIELKQRQIQPQIILPNSDGTRQTEQWFQEAELSVERNAALVHGFGKRRISGIPRLARLVRSFPASVVNIHYGMNFASLNDVLAVRLAGKRCVVSLHAGGGSDPLPKATRRLKNEVAARFCSAVIAVSVFQGNEIYKHGTLKNKIYVIPSGIPLSVKNLPIRQQARSRFGVPSCAFVIVTAARLGKPKGIAELIDAVATLSSAQATWKEFGMPFLLIAGEGPERAALEERAKSQLDGRYRFLGFVGAMSELYAGADLFVLASHEESFGLVYAEAAIHGLPVIGTTVGGVPETIGDKRTGLLVPPKNCIALADSIDSLWRDMERRITMGTLAKMRAEQTFSMRAMTDRYQEVLFPGLKIP